jgi:hypothetical protein
MSAINDPVCFSELGRNCQNCDYNYLRHPLWEENNACIQALFSQDTIRLISRKVTKLTLGVDPKGRRIIVPDDLICKVLDGVNQSYNRSVGDIYTRYFIQSDGQQNMIQSIIDQAIEVIVNNVRGQLGIEEENQKLSAWVQVYGNFNPAGLRQHPILKIKDRRPNVMEFNMNY